MLNRRHLRIRVLQFLYSVSLEGTEDISIVEKRFLKSLSMIEELYLRLFLMVLELQDYYKNYIEDSQKRKLPTYNDLNPNTTFLNNQFLKNIRENSDFFNIINKKKITFSSESKLIQKIFHSLSEQEFYNDYLSQENNFETDKKFVTKAIGKYLVDLDLFQDYLNDQNIFWEDDLPFITSMVLKTIKDATLEEVEFLKLFKDSDEKEFALGLLRQSVINQDSFSKLIEEKTKNWDLDRVAQMDLLMMQMALAELLKMPTVPTKVTINEYIELAKYYSTPKSKSFVNGVLDSLLADLMKDGQINKIGRGLIE